MDWADRPAKTIRRRTADGTITGSRELPGRPLVDRDAGGHGLLIDTTDLVRVDPNGRVTTLARGLASWSPKRLLTGSRHALMGLWTDGRGNVYVADYGGGVVKRVTPARDVSVAARSSLPWSPTGGTFDAR